MTGILKNRGISVAIALLTALALVLSTMMPLLPTGRIKLAHAANEAATGTAISRSSDVAGATATYTVVFTNGTAGGVNNTILVAGDTITVDLAGAGTVGLIQQLATTTVTAGAGITGCTVASTVAAGGDASILVVTLGTGCTVANDAVGVTLVFGNIRNGAVSAAATLGTVATNGATDDVTAQAGGETPTDATTAVGLSTMSAAGIGIGATVTSTQAVGGNFFVSAFLNVAGGAVSFSTTNGVFANTNTTTLTCLDAGVCDLDGIANMVTVLVVGSGTAGNGTVSASFAGATSTKTVNFIGAAASGAVTPTAAQNIAADAGTVILTATFSDSQGIVIPAGSVVTATTSLGNLTGTGQDAGGTQGACVNAVCSAGTSSATGTYKVTLNGGGYSGTAVVTFIIGTVSTTKSVVLSGLTATITSVNGEYDTNAADGVFAVATAVQNGLTPSAAAITNGFRIKATFKDAIGNVVGAVTPTIATTVSGVTFAACGASSAVTGIATCIVTAQPTVIGTTVAFTITSGLITATGSWKIGATFSSTTSTVEVAAPDIASVTAGSITVTLKDSAGLLVGDSTSVTLVVTAGALVASTALTSDGVATFTYVSPSAVQAVNATALVGTKTGSKTFNVGTVTAPGAGPTVTASGAYTVGLNSVVVMGGGSAASVSAALASASAKTVTAIWVYKSGSWTFYLPGSPSVDGGLSTVDAVASVFCILS